MAAPKSAHDILITELKEIHSAEKQLSRAVPKLLKAVESESLRTKVEERRERGARLIEGVDAALEEMEATKARPKNVAAEGLIADMQEHLEEIEEPVLLEPVMLASMQKLEHYCIAAWGTARSLGQLLEAQSVVDLMERALEEGRRFDEELTELAESELNPAMLEQEDEDMQEAAE